MSKSEDNPLQDSTNQINNIKSPSKVRGFNENIITDKDKENFFGKPKEDLIQNNHISISESKNNTSYYESHLTPRSQKEIIQKFKVSYFFLTNFLFHFIH